MIDIGTISVSGRRPYNQDKVFAKCSNQCFVLAVADGMGGANGGEIASGLVIESVKKSFAAFTRKPTIKEMPSCLEAIVRESQRRIRREVSANIELSGMGTTLTIVLGIGNKYIVGNIGDSRTYLVTQNQIRKITKDNSLSQDYLDEHAGEEIDLDSVRSFDHVLTRSISAENEPVDIYDDDGETFSLQEQDLLLLCSDGLIIDKLDSSSADLLETLRNSTDPSDAVSNLMSWAYESGSNDNISAIVGTTGFWTDLSPDEPHFKPPLLFRRLAYITSSLLLTALVLILYFDSKSISPSDELQTHSYRSPLSNIENDCFWTQYPNSVLFGRFPGEVGFRPPDQNGAEVQPELRFEGEGISGMLPSGDIQQDEPIRWSCTAIGVTIKHFEFKFMDTTDSAVQTYIVSSDSVSVILESFVDVEPKQSYLLWIIAVPSDTNAIPAVSSDTLLLNVH